MWVFFCIDENFYILSITKNFLNGANPLIAFFFSCVENTLIKPFRTSLTFESLLTIFRSSYLWAYFQIIKAWCWTNWEFITNLRQRFFFFWTYYLLSINIGVIVSEINDCMLEKHFSAKKLCSKTLPYWLTFLQRVKDLNCSPILFLISLFMQYFFRSIAM